MTLRFILGVVACALAATGQTPSVKTPQRQWTPASRTPDGQPDIQGIWTNSVATPLERPAALAGKEFFTPAELKENEKKAVETSSAEAIAGTAVHYDFSQFGLDPAQSKRATTARTSLIFEPSDGKIPPLTAEGKQRQAERAARNRGHQFDGVKNRPLGERCVILPQEGPPMIAAAYNNNMEIFQTPGYVVIELEMIHDARIIPLDGSPHLPAEVTQWMGDPRGHWEGNTLVVDSTNFNDQTNFRGASRNLHLIERFTRTAPDTIMYRFTVEDPSTWVQPWSAEVPMTATEGPLYEFACHEANYGLVNTLKGARAKEKEPQ